jgi:hypothetical protein
LTEVQENEETVADPFAQSEEKSDFEKQVEILDPVSNEVTVTLVNPHTGDSKDFTQKELAFIPKTRLLSLVATTLRAASDQDGNIGEVVSDMFGGVNDLIAQGVDPADAESFATNQFLDVILRLVEIAPDFLDRLYLLVLNVPKKDTQWVMEALEVIDDEQGIAILDTAIAQNAEALKSFFDTHLRKIMNRVQGMGILGEDTEQE